MNTWTNVDAPAQMHLLMRRGADHTIPLTFKESQDGPAIDLTGYAFECEVLADREDSTPLLSVTVTVIDALNGETSIDFTRTQTDDPETLPRDCWWRMWWTIGSARRCVIAGRIRMEE